MPVEAESLTDEDIEMLEREEKVDYRHGDHVPHWKKCPAAEEFRKSIKK
jgi:hypothetical protein